MKNLIVFSILLALTACQPTSTTDPAFKTIMVKSVGEIEALPDEATFHISLYCLDSSVKASKDCLVAKSNELIGRLQAFKIDKKHILTTSVNLDKSYTWRNNSNVFEGYRSSTTLIVTIKNIEALDEIYTELLENRNLEIGGLSFAHSKQDSLENEAYVRALKKSEKLADKLLTALPEDDKEVLKIGNVEITASVPKRNRYEMADAVTEQASAVGNQSSIGINAGTIKVAATLFVEYQIR